MNIFYKLENKKLLPSPQSIILEDGTTIINFHLVANQYGYKELRSEPQPLYNEAYQNLQPVYEETETHISEKWQVVNTMTLDEYKEHRIQYFNDFCNKTILDGFNSLGHRFKFDYEDQGNFTQQLLLLVINSTIQTIPWKTEDAAVQAFTKEQFMQIIQDAQIHKSSNIQRYWGVKQRILNAESYDKASEIGW